ncbi:ParA family protein [Mycolicibacterium sp.]|uniref:ParA family protein n=1 Tax=Mycolicibacterium sp. TaxID=2320850 RepID=UPI0037CB011F
MATRIITVAAAKGGVGKTTLSYELAAALDGVLVDMDWDAGGATRMWGFDPTRAARAPLLDALERGPGGTPPRLKRRANQPSLVPSHPDLSASRIDADLVADCLQSWAEVWSEPYLVVDTHPGANPLTDGAMQAADLVVIPVVLGAREMDALEAILADFASYRLLLVPTMIPPIPPRRFVDRLAALADGRVAVAPPISEHRWLRRRLRRAALVRQPNPGVRVRAAAAEFEAVAASVKEACDG